MKKYKINRYEYEIIKDYKDGFLLDEIINKDTEYFDPYDYIVGDWSYGKLRLKGFCAKQNKLYRKANDIENVEQYLKDYCSYECRYFILKKVQNNENNRTD